MSVIANQWTSFLTDQMTHNTVTITDFQISSQVIATEALIQIVTSSVDSHLSNRDRGNCTNGNSSICISKAND